MRKKYNPEEIYAVRGLQIPTLEYFKTKPSLSSPFQTHVTMAFNHIYGHPYPVKSELYLNPYEHRTRTIHGILHAAQAAHWGRMIFNLRKRRALPDDPVNEMDYEDLALIMIGLLFHDAARLDDGKDHWDNESAALCFDYCHLTLGVPYARAREIAEAIANKDYQPGDDYWIIDAVAHEGNVGYDLEFTKQKEVYKNPYTSIIHDADCLDIMRCTKNFDARYLHLDSADPNIERLIAEINLSITRQQNTALDWSMNQRVDCYLALQPFYQRQPFLAALADMEYKAPLPERVSTNTIDPIIKNFFSDTVTRPLYFRGIIDPFHHTYGIKDELRRLNKPGGNPKRSASLWYYRTPHTYTNIGFGICDTIDSSGEHEPIHAWYDIGSSYQKNRVIPDEQYLAPNAAALRHGLKTGRPKKAICDHSNEHAYSESFIDISSPKNLVFIAGNIDKTVEEKSHYVPRILFWLMCLQQDFLESNKVLLPVYIFSMPAHQCHRVPQDRLTHKALFPQLIRELFHSLIQLDNTLPIFNATDEQLLTLAILGKPFYSPLLLDTKVIALFKKRYFSDDQYAACLSVIKKHRSILIKELAKKSVNKLYEKDKIKLSLSNFFSHRIALSLMAPSNPEIVTAVESLLAAEPWYDSETYFYGHGIYNFSVSTDSLLLSPDSIPHATHHNYGSKTRPTGTSIERIIAFYQFFKQVNRHDRLSEIKGQVQKNITRYLKRVFIMNRSEEWGLSSYFQRLYISLKWLDGSQEEWRHYITLLTASMKNIGEGELEHFTEMMKNDAEVSNLIHQHCTEMIEHVEVYRNRKVTKNLIFAINQCGGTNNLTPNQYYNVLRLFLIVDPKQDYYSSNFSGIQIDIIKHYRKMIDKLPSNQRIELAHIASSVLFTPYSFEAMLSARLLTLIHFVVTLYECHQKEFENDKALADRLCEIIDDKSQPAIHPDKQPTFNDLLHLAEHLNASGYCATYASPPVLISQLEQWQKAALMPPYATRLNTVVEALKATPKPPPLEKKSLKKTQSSNLFQPAGGAGDGCNRGLTYDEGDIDYVLGFS